MLERFTRKGSANVLYVKNRQASSLESRAAGASRWNLHELGRGIGAFLYCSVALSELEGS